MDLLGAHVETIRCLSSRLLLRLPAHPVMSVHVLTRRHKEIGFIDCEMVNHLAKAFMWPCQKPFHAPSFFPKSGAASDILCGFSKLVFGLTRGKVVKMTTCRYEHVNVNPCEEGCAHLSWRDGGVVDGDEVRRDAVAPPQLAGDAPVPVGGHRDAEHTASY